MCFCISGPNEPVSVNLGFSVSWFLGFKDSWFLGFLVSWFLGFLVSWFLGVWFLGFVFFGFLVSWFMASWFLGFEVSKFQRFEIIQCFWRMLVPYYQISMSCFLVDDDLISKLFKIVLDGSSGFVGACLFENCQHFGCPNCWEFFECFSKNEFSWCF